MTTPLLDRLTHHYNILETSNETIRFICSTAEAKRRIKAREQERNSSRSPEDSVPFWSAAVRGKPLRETPYTSCPARSPQKT